MSGEGHSHRRKHKPSGILRLDINKPRRSSGSSVEFRCQPELIGEVSQTSPSPQLSVRWAYPKHLHADTATVGDSSDEQTSQMQNYQKNDRNIINLKRSPNFAERRLGGHRRSSPGDERLSDKYLESLTIDSSSPFDIPDYINSEEEDYSVSVCAVMQRRASIRGGRRLGTLSPRRTSSVMASVSVDRRRSSVFTTSSGETAISINDGTNQQDSTKEQIFENIKLHKEVLQSVKMQPWGMKRKLRIVRQAKEYVARHEGALQERFAMSRSTKDLWARFKILLAARLHHYKREIANISTVLIPWELRIKEIESHFGSVVASYFTFLRWLFWVNIVIAMVLAIFVVIPEFLASQWPSRKEDHRKDMLPEELANATRLISLWDFEGFLKYSPLFYGYYSDFSGAVQFHYELPLAYFLTGLLVYIYSFWATLRKMAENSRMSKLSSKDDECIFSWKLFTGWDYMIGHAETAHNRIASVVLGFKEALLEEAEKKKDKRNWKIIGLRVIVNFLVLHLLAASAYAVIFVVNRSTEEGANDSYWRRNEITVVITAISFFFPMFFEVLGLLESYHPRKQLRMQLARIMALNLLNLYSLIFALFDKISQMNKTLINLRDNITMSRDLMAMAQHTSTLVAPYGYQNSTRDDDDMYIIPTAMIETVVDNIASTILVNASSIYSNIIGALPEHCHRIVVNCSTILKTHNATILTSLVLINVTSTVIPNIFSNTTNIGALNITDEKLFNITQNFTNFYNISDDYDTMENITFNGLDIRFENDTNLYNETNNETDENSLNIYDEMTVFFKKLHDINDTLTDLSTTDQNFVETTTTPQTTTTITVNYDTSNDDNYESEYDDEYEETTVQKTTTTTKSTTTANIDEEEYDDDDYEEITTRKVTTTTTTTATTAKITSHDDYSEEEYNEYTNKDKNTDDAEYSYKDDELYQNDEYSLPMPLTQNQVTEEPEICYITVCQPIEDLTQTATQEPISTITSIDGDVTNSTFEYTTPSCMETTTGLGGSLHPFTDFNFDNTTEFVTESLAHFIGNMDTTKQLELRKLCWETMFGQELVKLTVMDLVATITSILFMDFFRALFVRFFNKFWCWDLEKRYPKYGDFKIAENILHLVNNQGQVWMGMFFSPGLAILNLIKLVIIMYMRSWAVLTCNVPHEVVFRASRSNNFYLALLLTMLFLCVLPVGYAIVWLRPSWHCGPFSHYNRIYLIFTDTLRRVLPPELHRPLDYIASPSTVIPLLLLLILIIYYLVSLTGALREANQDLRIQLRRERTEERRKMLTVVKEKDEDVVNAGTAIDRWRKVIGGAASPLTPSNASGGTPNPDEEKLAARKELLARIMKKALRKGSNTSEDDSHPAHAASPAAIGDDETDTEQNESLPHDDKPVTKHRKSTHRSSIDENKVTPVVKLRKPSISRLREIAKRAAASTSNDTNEQHPRGRYKIDKKPIDYQKPNDQSPNDYDDPVKVVSERRKSLMRRQNSQTEQMHKTGGASATANIAKKSETKEDVNYKIVNEKNQAMEKKARLKVRSKAIEPEVFLFDEDDLVARQRDFDLTDEDNASYKEIGSDRDKSIISTFNPESSSRSSNDTFWNRDGADETIARQAKPQPNKNEKTDKKQYSPPEYAVVMKRKPQPPPAPPPKVEPSMPKVENVQIQSPTDSDKLPPEKRKSKLTSILALVREAVQSKKLESSENTDGAKALPMSPPPVLGSGGESNSAPGSRRDSIVKLSKRSSSKRHRRTEPPPKPKRQDSQASIWSDNIPVITISKTTSDECILESHSDHSTPKKSKNNESKSEKKVEKY